ncbi:protein-tyrosine phosphatase-like protein [Trichophaea hybrida]|nr:protein-tyrosine phosphatase-like protein [Trichophaea hybrida]
MLLETLLRHLLRLYLQISSEKHPLLLETLNRITRACSSSSFSSPNASKPTLAMRAVVSTILPGKLFLSGITAASSPETLKEYEITHVLSVVTTSEAPKLPNGINHRIIPLSDTSTSNLLQILSDAIAFIEPALRKSEDAKVLVHCVEGISRSASIVIAYLMSERGMSFSQALRIVKRRRAVVSPNLGFIRQLSEWGTICEAKRRERPREWEQVLRKRKASPPAPPVTVVKVPKRSKISWVRWAFTGDSGCRMS